jgi:molecular chaperone DnaK (HSP70)
VTAGALDTVILVDTVAGSLGVEVGVDEVAPLVDGTETIPTEAWSAFGTAADGQDAAGVRVLERERGADVGGLLGEVLALREDLRAVLESLRE